MSKSPVSIVRWVAVIATAAACVLITPLLLAWVRYMSLEPYCNDSSFFWTIGRGIVNGLTPYKDLFDHKMPGIFLITALSMKLTGGLRLAYLFETFIVFGIPLLATLAVLRKTKWNLSATLVAPMATLAFGAIISIYLVIRTYGYQTEHFGSFFGCLYAIALFSMPPSRPGVSHAVFASLILMTVGIKEPYVAILAAVALINARSIRHFLQIFLWPFLTAALAGLLILLVLGWLPAFTIYLREVCTFVLPGGIGAHRSILERMFVFGVLRNFWDFSHAAPVAAILLTVAVTFFSNATLQRLWVRILKMLGALILTGLAVNSGPHLYPHHQTMAVPVMLALLLCFEQIHIASPDSLPVGGFAAAFGILLVIASSHIARPPFSTLNWMLNEKDKVQLTADRVDDILTACGNPPWASLSVISEVPSISGLMKHSPVGPIFCLLPYSTQTSEYIRDSIRGWIVRSDVVVEQARALDTNYLGVLQPVVMTQIHGEFSSEPWDCAKDKPLPEDGTRLYFRRGARPQQLPAGGHP